MPRREVFVRNLTNALLEDSLSPDMVRKVVDTVVLQLKDYSIDNICTTLALSETEDSQLIKLYIGTILTEGKSMTTAYAYQRSIYRMLNFIKKPLKDINVFDIRIYLAHKQQNASKSYTENERSYMSAFFKWLFDEEFIERNPMSKIKPVKFTRDLKYPLSSVEVDKLRSACKTLRDRAMIEMLLSSGVRVSELGNLDITDVNFDRLEVTVRHGKGDKNRVTVMSDVAKCHLKAYLESRTDDTNYLFITKHKTRLTKGSVRNALHGIANTAKVQNVHPHRCRRTFATLLAKKGVPITTIQALLGHVDINTTKRYITLDNDAIRHEIMRYID